MIVPDDHDPYETLKRSKYIIQDIKFDDSKLIDSLKNLIPISGSVSPLNVSLFIQSLLGKFYLSEIGNNERKLINYLTDYIYLHNHLIEEAICSLIVLSTASSSSEASWFRTLENSSLSTVGKCFLSALSKRDPYSFFSPIVDIIIKYDKYPPQKVTLNVRAFLANLSAFANIIQEDELNRYANKYNFFTIDMNEASLLDFRFDHEIPFFGSKTIRDLLGNPSVFSHYINEKYAPVKSLAFFMDLINREHEYAKKENKTWP